MTPQELYDWALAHNAEHIEIGLQYDYSDYCRRRRSLCSSGVMEDEHNENT